MITLHGKYTNADIMIDNVDEGCIAQIYNMVNNGVFTNPIRIMPDCHAGTGSVIGFTMLAGDKIIPNIIGVDIGCGMLSVNIGNINIDLVELEKLIRELIPFGMNINKKGVARLDKRYQVLCDKIGMDFDYAVKSLASIGSGNHFCEIGKSVNTDDIWITVHTGSRNLGKKVCEYWQNKASMREIGDPNEVIKGIKEVYPKKEWDKRIKAFKVEMNNVKKSDLDYLEGDDKEGYLQDMYLAQEYAAVNRLSIMNGIMGILGFPKEKDKIETVHNYVSPVDKIIRKGSISAYIGERMIIPFNMQAGLLICEGKSNKDWNYSAPHGAGRVLSRSKAKELLDLDKFKDDMKDIYSTSVCRGTIDEAPEAYKDPAVIEAAIEPTTTILDRVKPICNMKDISEEKSWKKKR